MIELLPRLSEQFHLTPSDVYGLTLVELAAYLDAAKRTDAEMDRLGA